MLRIALSSLCLLLPVAVCSADETVDFIRDIRPILSNKCFRCHGPDDHERKGGSDGVRFDTEEGLLADIGGYAAVVRGKPEASVILTRLTTTNVEEIMPPPETGSKVSAKEIELIRKWIAQGAPYSKHWSYVAPQRPAVPDVKNKAWSRNAIDTFLLARLEKEGLQPSPEADRATLIRRAMLDLTGLPPSIEEVDVFLKDASPDAYEKLIDRILKKETYGEHAARIWLDLARYADSAGYADDPPRVIWGYRDWVVKAFNENMPFDRFSIEQLAGDLLPNPTNEQLIATAFHRNTLTNNEGGTNDEEYRNVAIVDRVNTTLAVWMGTSFSCAQCHTHKYDPILQTEYFQVFSIFNNTADADRRDESPLVSYYSPSQEQERKRLQAELAAAEQSLYADSPERLAAQAKWEASFPVDLAWKSAKPIAFTARSGAAGTIRDDGSVLVASNADKDAYTLMLPLSGERIAAMRLEALPEDSLPKKGPGHSGGNFVISNVAASINPPNTASLSGRYVRIELPGSDKMISLAEVQVFKGAENLATGGEASQSSTDYDGPAKLAIDGNTNGDYQAKSVTHTAVSNDPWWELDLKSAREIDRIVLWNRTDGNLQSRLTNFQVRVLNEKRETVWEKKIEPAFEKDLVLGLSGVRDLPFVAAFADHTQAGFDAADVLPGEQAKPRDKKIGWAIAPNFGKPAALTLIAKETLPITPSVALSVSIAQDSNNPKHTLGCFRITWSDDPRAAEFVKTPADMIAILKTPAASRTPEQAKKLRDYFLTTVSTETKPLRDKIAGLKKSLDDVKPVTVPIMKELETNARRVTKLQYRGNFLDLGPEVKPGVPAVFPPLPAERAPDRLALAEWLMAENNPLTARVVANRFWDQIFGVGLVRTSEEFGAQGELPSHPELLDWLAVELRESKWDVKRFMKLLVTSAAYRQSSRTTPEAIQRDPENRLIARGPRFRLSAEMIRDQALAVSGLLSSKMYGPSVKPPRPNLGLSAAFGGGLDWQTSSGEDKFRRGLYTEWRRTSPYPSMSTFDAPNREVCTIRRNRTNTPLQALVTMNDPVYVEASQALARRIASHGSSPAEKVVFAFKLCLSREPNAAESARIVRLYEETKAEFAKDKEKAMQLATNPLGPLPAGSDATDLAAWTVVSNVILNLDEMLSKR